VGGLTREALAERAGVDVGYVYQLVELGIIVPPEAGSLFSGGDVRRVRLVRGLEEGGLSVEGMGTAVRNGDLSFGFLDLPSWDWYGGFVGKTMERSARRPGSAWTCCKSFVSRWGLLAQDTRTPSTRKSST
jgi:hypothetical protein